MQLVSSFVLHLLQSRALLTIGPPGSSRLAGSALQACLESRYVRLCEIFCRDS